MNCISKFSTFTDMFSSAEVLVEIQTGRTKIQIRGKCKNSILLADIAKSTTADLVVTKKFLDLYGERPICSSNFEDSGMVHKNSNSFKMWKTQTCSQRLQKPQLQIWPSSKIIYTHTFSVASAPLLMQSQAGYAKIQIRSKCQKLKPARRHSKIRNCRSDRLQKPCILIRLPSFFLSYSWGFKQGTRKF